MLHRAEAEKHTDRTRGLMLKKKHMEVQVTLGDKAAAFKSRHVSVTAESPSWGPSQGWRPSAQL